MATRKTPSTTRKTAPRKNNADTREESGPEVVALADLPDAKGAQISEAMEKPTAFRLRDGENLVFGPVADWPFRATQAFLVGDLITWARNALADPDDLDRFLDQGQRDVGRIIQYFNDHSGVTRGEADSSSQS